MIYGFVAGLLVLVGLPTNAFADTITGPGSPSATVVTTVVGSPASAVFKLNATQDAGESSAVCNIRGSASAALTFTVSGGPSSGVVTQNPTTGLTFNNCGQDRTAQFTPSVAGDYTITPVVTPVGIATAPAAFTLRVGAAPTAAAATTLTLATATGVYNDAAVDLKATLKTTTAGTPVVNKLVNFSVAGVAVGSSATDASGVATLSVALNQTRQVGSYATSASFQADSSFQASSASQLTGLTVTKAGQTITFAQPANTTFGTAAYAVPSSASSGLATTLASTTALVCTVSGSTVTLVAAGTCTLTATQAGDGNWNAAAPVSRDITVGKASQTVSLGLSRYSATFNDNVATTVTASASSGLTVATSVTSGPCSLSGTSLTATGAGTCVVTGSQAGNGNYNAAETATQSLSVSKADQSITFGELAAKTFGDAAFDVSATTTSNLAVAFTAAPAGVCSFAAGKVSVNGAGQCTVTARQAGNADFNSAPDVVRTFAVNKAAQTITFAPLTGKTFGDAAFDVSATAAGGVVTFSATGACDVAGTLVTITGAGDCTVTAAQGGNANYEAATSVARTFMVAKATQTITLPVLVDRTYPVTAALVTGASSTSDLQVAVSAGPSSVCTASGGSITVTGAGTCNVTTSQAGNANYLPAAPVSQSFTVAKADQSITFDVLDPQTFGVAAIALSATASSGLDVAFASTTPLVCTVEAGPKLAVNAAGTCTVVASQVGDDNHNPAVSVPRTFAVAKSGQSISLAIGPGSATFGDASRLIDASATSGLTVALSVSGPCTVSGTTLTITGAGTCVVDADQAGNGNYNAAPRETRTLNVARANQEISFPAVANKTFGDAPFALDATVNSPLTVGYSTSDASVCTVTGATLTVVGAGECTVTAEQAGNENYNSAGDVAHTFTVAKAAQTITFAALTGKTFGNAPFEVTATATSGETVVFSATGDCEVAGTLVTITGAGICTVTADQGGSANYRAATSVPRTFTIAKAPQAITFGTLLAKTFGDDNFTVSAGTSSGLSAAFASATPAACSVTDSTVAILTAGTCTVTASQAGNVNYLAAAPVSQSFTVAKKDQTIDFEQPAGKTFGAAAFELRATASSALAVTFTASPQDVCTVSGKTVTITGAGNCTLTADQAGNGNYNAAPTSSRTVIVSKSGQTIAVTVDSATPTFGDGPVTVTATSTSDLPVVLTSTGPCTLGTATTTGTPLTLTGAGNCTVLANQVGDRNYLPAEQQESVVAIGRADQTVTFAALTGKTFGDAPVALTATAGSGLPVTYVATPTSVCSIEVTAAGASTVKINGAGDCEVTAGQEGDANYIAADDVVRLFTVAKADQTVTFAALANRTFGDADFTLGATASSGRTVTYTTTGPCTVGAGASLSITGAGTCAVTASQVGNSNYKPAPPVTQSFTIAKAAQTITFDILPAKTYGDDGFAVTASSSSGLTVTVSSNTPGVCAIDTAGITIKSAGTCTLTASQAGNANYNAATPVDQSFAVAKAGLTVTGPTVSKVLASPNPALAPSYSGFVYTDAAASLTTPATCTTAATTTSPVGTYDVTCSGAVSGNYSFSYVKGLLTVAYKYSGLLQPINVDRSSAFKAGSTIPVKWQVLDANNVVQDAGTLRTTIRVTKTGTATAAATNETVVTVPGDASAAFRWDTSGKQYIYNLSTKTWAMGAGTYRADVISATGQVLTTGGFQVKA